MLAGIVPVTSTAAGGTARSLPFELEAPKKPTLAKVYDDPRDTLMNVAYAQPAGIRQFIADSADAKNEGRYEEFLAPSGYSQIDVVAQIDWSLDSETDWKYDEVIWSEGETGYGYDEEWNLRVGYWEYVDRGWITSEAVLSDWMFSGWGYDYEEWREDETWVGTETRPGLRDQLPEGSYTVDDEGLHIDWTQHTMNVRVRYAVVARYYEGDVEMSDEFFSDWSPTGSFGKDAVRWEPPVEGDVAAPTVSGLRMTDEEFNGWPVIAYTLDAPDELTEMIAEIEARGGSFNIETECRELGSEGEWIKLQGDWVVQSGELRSKLITLSGVVEMTEYTSLEFRARYCVSIWINEPDREADYDFYTDYSDILVFKGKDVPPVHDHDWGELIVDDKPSCTEEGKGHYICSICEERWDVDIPANGHTWTDIVVTLEPNCTEYGLMNRRCQVCGEVETNVPVDPLGHDTSGEEIVDDKPTCTEGGTAHTICVRCGERVDYELGELGHDWSETTVIKKPTCTENGKQGKVCTRCGVKIDEEVIPKLGHDWSDEWTVRTEPTCTEPGLQFSKCTRCDAERTEGIRALGHDYAVTVVGETCTAQGYTLHKCSRCGDEFRDNYKDALGHDWDEGAVTKEPTHDEEGVLTHTCKRCGEKYDERMMKLLSNTAEIFDDVSANDWFVNYVDYAYSYGLMNGTSDKTFAPNGTMTRAMLVTVLWRIEGKPASSVKSPFTDLTADWYVDAVSWAYENEIVKGMSETKFDPNGALTREQIAAIIYRYSSFKGNDVSKTTDITKYPDYKSVSSWAVANMRWAVAEGLISGSRENGKDYLAPQAKATRAQVAAILMRYLER